MKNLLFLFFLLSSSVSFTQGKILQSIVEVSFFFDRAKWNVKVSDQNMEKFTKAYFTSDNAVVRLVGYTDTIGTPDYNRALADFRLKSVEKLFTSKGIKVQDKVIVGETAEAGKPLSYNRRVEAVILIPAEEEDKKPVIIEKEAEADLDSNEGQVEPWKLELNVPIVLQIEFHNGTAELMPYSYSEVDKLFFILSDHPDYNIQLHGHVCCSDSYQTSLNRAVTVKGELIRKGINAERIAVFGHSNRKPLAAEVDDESKQRNRRVEVVFIDE